MRILICGSQYPPELNGQSIFTANLAEGMAARGHSVQVILPGRGLRTARKLRNGVELIEVPAFHPAFIHKDLHLPFGFERIIREQIDQFRPDLVHAQDPSPLCQAALREAHRRGIPTFATHHPGPEISAPYLNQASPRLKKAVEWAAWRFVLAYLHHADVVTVPSRASAAMLARAGLGKPARPLSCGICLDDFCPDPGQDRAAVRRAYGLDPGQVLFLYIGRIDIEKRVDVLVRAMARTRSEKIQLAIAGSGATEAALRYLIQREGLGERVRLLGKIAHEDLQALINCADGFAMPGDAESFSIATLEAMACGKPVLAANAAALPELVRHRVNGYLFQPGQPEDAARGLEFLSRHTEMWPAMRSASLERSRRHRLENVLGQYEMVYNASLRRGEQSAVRAGGYLPGSGSAQRGAFLSSLTLKRGLAARSGAALLALLALFFTLIFTSDSSFASSDIGLDDLAARGISQIEEIFENQTLEGDMRVDTEGPAQKMGKKSGEIFFFLPDKKASHEVLSDAWLPLDKSLRAALIELGIPEEMLLTNNK